LLVRAVDHQKGDKTVKSFLILGAGRQGVAIADGLKALDPGYHVEILDSNYARIKNAPRGLDECIHDSEWPQYIPKGRWSVVISALPYSLNEAAAKLCVDIGVPYMDLGGHAQTSEVIKTYAFKKRGTVATDQGLAPGLLNLMAWKVVGSASKPVKKVEMYSGALPAAFERSPNFLNYCATSNVAGLVNEYLNDIHVLQDGKIVEKDRFTVDQEVNDFEAVHGLEAFRTSGATPPDFLRSMARAGVRDVDYRTLRYRGHVEKIREIYLQFLLREIEAAVPPKEKAQERLAALITRVCKPPEGFADEAVCRVRVTYEDGLQENYDSLIEGDSETKGTGSSFTAMQIGTGYSAAAAASIMATGKVKGVVGYHDLVDAGFFAEASNLEFIS
jgi:saccharopine dehydrogenase-like NADP-dependent oxidoreductase